jgi:outer membrane protein OmpA-like peptidoglycan-associated protein
MAALALSLTAAAAWADAVYVSLANQRAMLGQNVPSVNVQILEPIAGFWLKLKRSDGKDVQVKGGGRPGQTRVLDLTQPEGKFEYEGELLVNLPNGDESRMPLKFEAALFGPLRMKFDKKDFDLEKRKAVFRLSRPASKAHVKVLMDTGKVAMDGEVNFNGEAADTPLEVTWPEAKGKVMTVNIQGFDTETFFTGVEISPWQVDIPHEEVNFDSGKWDIRPEEREKLDKSSNAIDEAVTKYGRLAEIKLFIAGHTDTVGPNASNRTLSLNRARSIGGYFKKKGLRIPVLYEGFGEEALLVQTADETAEAKNRRAEYIIAIENPETKNAPFAPKWQRL